MKNIQDYKNKWFDFVNYTPHKGQELLHNPPKGIYNPKTNPKGVRYTIVSAGRRFGKSYSAARELELQLCIPKSTCWIVAPNYVTAGRIFEFIYMELVVNKKYKPSRYSAKDLILEFEWEHGKSGLYGKSAENPAGLVGAGVDLLVLDEAAKIPNLEKLWQMYLRPTLSDTKGRMIAISTPEGMNYFHKMFLMGQTEENWFSYNSPSHENNFAFPEGENDPDLIEAKRNLAKEVYRQEYLAEFTSLQGRVYNDFTRADNTGVYKYRYDLPTFLTIDFGYRMPAVIWFQTETINDVEHIYIIDEIIHQRNLKTTDLIAMIKERPYALHQIYGDPAGNQASALAGASEWEIFFRHTGWRIFALRNKSSRSIASGISHVRNFILSEDGTRRLHVDTKCKGIIEDFEGYCYPEHKEHRDLKELPVKDGRFDHGMDCVRYGIINRFPIKNYQIKLEDRR